MNSLREREQAVEWARLALHCGGLLAAVALWWSSPSSPALILGLACALALLSVRWVFRQMEHPEPEFGLLATVTTGVDLSAVMLAVFAVPSALMLAPLLLLGVIFLNSLRLSVEGVWASLVVGGLGGMAIELIHDYQRVGAAGGPGVGAWVLVAGIGAGLAVQTQRTRAILDQYATAQDANDRFWGALAPYFSPRVAEVLFDSGPGALATGRREISVLFADLSGFTTFTEVNAPDVVTQTLGEYLEELSRVALRYDGNIDKFMGDELMVVFNAPLQQTDHAARALNCAREMQVVMGLCNEARRALGKTILGLSVGVNTGEAVVGHVGGGSRIQYTVIGDAVNVAKRLQGQARPGEVMVGGRTLELAGDAQEGRFSLQVKGRAHAVDAIRLQPVRDWKAVGGFQVVV